MHRLPLISIVLVVFLAAWAGCGDSGVDSGLGQLGDTGGLDGLEGGDLALDATADAQPDADPQGEVQPGEDAAGDAGPGEDSAGPPDSSGATCGNEICEQGENALTCRKDCKATGALLCLATDCKSALDACFELPSCVTSAACALDCTDEACRDACQDGLAGATSFVVDGLVSCGEDAECFASAGTCPGACGELVEGATCQCQDDCEVFNDCCEGYEAECAGGVTCAEDKCPAEFAACQALPECEATVACAAACTTTACVVACGSGKSQAVLSAFQGLRTCTKAQCAPVGPACGDGTCDEGETTENCAADCKAGGPVCGNGSCEATETPANCAADCKAGPVCGDGKCETPETAANCAADCKASTSPLVTCIDQQCNAELAACVANAECVKAVTCLEKCAATDQGCVTNCASKGGFGQQAIDLALCVAGSSCLSGGGSPDCGNGTCGAGETTQNCPADCPPTPNKCGNGKCDQGENQFNCAGDCPSACGNGVCDQFEEFWCQQDCPATQPTCPNGKCEQGETTASCPADCPPQPGNCGNGTCESTETAASCPADCSGSGGDGLLECLAAKCKTQLAACEAKTSCDDALPCMAACVDGGQTGCTVACGQQFGMSQELTAIGQCGGAQCLN